MTVQKLDDFEEFPLPILLKIQTLITHLTSKKETCCSPGNGSGSLFYFLPICFSVNFCKVSPSSPIMRIVGSFNPRLTQDSLST